MPLTSSNKTRQEQLEPIEVVRIRRLLDRCSAANERHLRARVRLVVLPYAEEITADHLGNQGRTFDLALPAGRTRGRRTKVYAEPPATVQAVIPPKALHGCSKLELWGLAGIDRESVRANVLLMLVWQSPGSDAAARQFRLLAAESGRLYQTLPPRSAPIGATSSPRNLWATVLYAWLRGTLLVTAKQGFEVIALPFAASVELWRRLLYGTTVEGRVEPGCSQQSRQQRRPSARTGDRDRKLEARDHWIYRRSCAGVAYKEINAELKNLCQNKGWRMLHSIQGTRAAARKYAERHDLPYPAPRQQL
jgi:hypothetical protein